MKRLLDSPSAGPEPELERLARLLDHVPPLADEADRRTRVRLALRQREQTSWRLGRGALVVVSLLVAGVAAAAGQRLLQSRAPVAPVAPASPVDSIVAGRAAAAAAPSLAEPVPTSAPAPSATTSVSTASPVVPPRVAKRLAPAAPSGDDPGTRLMVEAMQARSAGKYGRALALLSDYQRRFPSGALQDEALALQVEMTSLQGAGDRARALGRAYLARFPNGRYRAWVSQSLAAAEP